MWKLDSTLQQDQPLCETLRKVLEETAWAETRLEVKEKLDFVAWNQVQRSHLLTTDVMPVDLDPLYRAAETVEPALNEQDENDDISAFGTPGVANYENQQEQEEGEEGQKVVAIEEKEQRGQLIASENQQEEEEESQVMAGEKVSQPSEEAKLPSVIANEGKTANDSQDDLSQTPKKTKIAAQADDNVVLLTSASAFPFQNAAQSMVLMPVQLPTMSGGFPSGFPFYVLQGNSTAANHNFTPAVASLHHSFVAKSTMKQSPGS